MREYHGYTYFTDIGYKHFPMPNGLTLGEYYDIIEEYNDKWHKEKDENGISRFERLYMHNDPDNFHFTESEFRYVINKNQRLEILFYLEDIPESEWSEKDRALLKYMISDIDFYSSEWQFGEIVKQCPNSG